MTFRAHRLALLATALYLFLFPFEHVLLNLWGIDTELKPYRIAMAAGLALGLPWQASLTKSARSPIWLLLLAYVYGLLATSLMLSQGIASLRDAQHALLLIAIGAAGMFSVTVSVRTTRDARFLLHTIAWGALASIVVWYLTEGSATAYRFSGFMRNPNHLGFILVVGCVVLLYGALKPGNSTMVRVIQLLMLVAGGVLILWTGSRAGALALVISLMFQVHRTLRAARGSRARTLAFLGIGAGAVFLLVPELQEGLLGSGVGDRFALVNMATGAGRVDLWKAAWVAFLDYYGFGMGIGQFPQYSIYYLGQLGIPVYEVLLDFDLAIHNQYLSLLVEFGLVAFVFYVMAMWVILRKLNLLTRAPGEQGRLAVTVLGLAIADIVFAFFQDMHYFPLHWGVLGLSVAFISVSQKVRPASDQQRAGGSRLLAPDSIVHT